MKCCNAGKKTVGKMLNENHKGGMEQRRGVGEVLWRWVIKLTRECVILLEREIQLWFPFRGIVLSGCVYWFVCRYSRHIV